MPVLTEDTGCGPLGSAVDLTGVAGDGQWSTGVGYGDTAIGVGHAGVGWGLGREEQCIVTMFNCLMTLKFPSVKKTAASPLIQKLFRLQGSQD